jgi:hypothetical protein
MRRRVYLQDTKLFQDWMAEKGYSSWPACPMEQENMMAEFLRDSLERDDKERRGSNSAVSGAAWREVMPKPKVTGDQVSRRSDWRDQEVEKLETVQVALNYLQEAHRLITHLNPGNLILSPGRLADLVAVIQTLENWENLIEEEIREIEETYGELDRKWVGYGH